MKKSLIALFAGCLVAFISTGCHKEPTVDTAKLQSAFASAPAEIKSQVDKAVASIKGNDYRSAISTMNRLINTKSNEMAQAQYQALSEAFVNANVLWRERGAEEQAAKAKADATMLENQAKEK